MKVKSEKELLKYGKELAEKIRSRENFGDTGAVVVELIGDVGVGKTTLTRGLAEGLGVKEPVTSPSFTISKTYALPDGGRLVHYDFYRLSDPGLMVGDLAENMTDKQNIVVIEWGESVGDLLPEKRMTIRLEYDDDGGRIIL